MTKPTVFLVLVLSTLAWSAPNRPIDEVNKVSENEADQGLEKLLTIANAPKEVLQNAKKTFDDIQQFIKLTQESIESMFVQLFKFEEMGANISTDIFHEVNEVKNELRECRQEFRRLAVTSVSHSKDLKDLAATLDPDIVILQATINTMKDLLINTKGKLTEIIGKYNNANAVMDKIKVDMTVLIMKFENLRNENSDEYNKFVEEVTAGTYQTCAGLAVGLVIADIFGCLGLCTGIGTTTCIGVQSSSVEDVLAEYKATINDFVERSSSVKDNMSKMFLAVDESVKVLEYQLDVVTEWDIISNNLSVLVERYPVKYLKKFKQISKVFIKNVEDLEKVAQTFLDQPILLFHQDGQFQNITDVIQENQFQNITDVIQDDQFQNSTVANQDE